MDALITILIYVVIFAAIAYGAWWVCAKFGMPPPVLWLVGAILLIFLLLFLARQVGFSFPVQLHR